jgi:hypothetical protein
MKPAAKRIRLVTVLSVLLLPAFLIMPMGLLLIYRSDLLAQIAAAPFAILQIVLLYLSSHFIRAVRFALLSNAAFGTSIRAGALLHLYTAPASLIIPSKLGEIWRIQQLSLITGKPAGAFLVVLLDRVLDCAVLLPAIITFMVATSHVQPQLLFLALLLFCVLFGASIVFFVGPGILTSVQRYVFLRHVEPRARAVLFVVAHLRDVVDNSGRSLRSNLPFLLLLSVAVWIFEASQAYIFFEIESAARGAPSPQQGNHVLGESMFQVLTITPIPIGALPSSVLPLLDFAALAPLWFIIAPLYIIRVWELGLFLRQTIANREPILNMLRDAKS